MDEMMKCPLCGGMHPKGTTFCDDMWADIPQELAEEAATTDSPMDSQDECAKNETRGRCPACGEEGIPGDECWQCGSVIEALAPGGVHSHVMLRVANGTGIPIELGKTIMIGRESDIRSISTLLAPFDVVSRRHCTICLSADGGMATISDCGSTNGTFVGPEIVRLDHGVSCTVKLPVTIRLGSYVNVTLEMEG